MDLEPNCLHCGAALTGRQARTCSPRCRKAIQRPPRPLKTCRLCKQPFQPAGPGQPSVCDYETEADDLCQGLQDDQEDAQASIQAARAGATCEGPACSVPLAHGGRGRPRRFCSVRCRSAAYRAEKTS